MDSGPVKREVVIPGDVIGDRKIKPGYGSYIDGENIYSSLLGIKSMKYGKVGVIRLSGRYMPFPEDLIIGIIIDRGPSHWLLDINAPYPAAMHPAETPWRIDFGDTGRFLDIGDVILANILSVDEIKRIQVTMNDRISRKITEGIIVDISPSKVARVIGKRGSMIAMLKDYTHTRIQVGQNGRVWVDGDSRDMAMVARAVEIIEENAHLLGLTESVRNFLETEYNKRVDAQLR